MHRVWLIARREIVAYAGVPSFWLALLIGPLLMLFAALGAGAMARAPEAAPAQVVALEAPNAELALAMKHALEEAAELEGRRIRVLVGGDKAASARLRLADGATGAELSVKGERLSAISLALLRRDVATVLREQVPLRARESGPEALHIRVSEPPSPAPQPQDAGRFARFSMSTLLWLALVGSLGMLLQAVVRERSNRALESLLSCARPSEIVLGKLAGVGALSALVIGVWLVGGALLAATPVGGASGAAALLLSDFSDISSLVAAGGLFLLAFGMYGSALIGVGALAQDVAAAQNLSRPVFGLLLAVFFAALGQLIGVGACSLPALALIPPFSPFILILAKPGSIDAVHVTVAVTGMCLTTLTCVWLASLALRGDLRMASFLARPRRLSA